MPVPVPPVPTHPVRKCNKAGGIASPPSSVLHPLKRTLPSPASPLLQLATRENWISSLSSRRESKPCDVGENGSCPVAPAVAHQVFSKGLAGAVDASAIKGAHVQTCIPPLNTLLSGCVEMPSCSPLPHDRRLALECSRSSDPGDRLSPASPGSVGGDIPGVRAWPHAPGFYLEDDSGLFAPVLEDDSPDVIGGDLGSSPVEPVTPFGDYVDRAVAASDATIFHNPLLPSRSQELHLPLAVNCSPQCCHNLCSDLKEELVVTVNERPPSASLIHKQLVEPMAEWMVTYVWKVCTNVLVLPQAVAPYTLPNAPQLLKPLPMYLAARVHSLLMSTLLQPSAMLLALWYIVRLPVYLGSCGQGSEHVKERRFRAGLLSNASDIDGESVEGTATFRLIVLGCMLANKWLDDHTFSNKTWHSISNVPVQLLNKLEYFALDILSYDLSISTSDWCQWLSHLLSYHHSLTTSTYPQPIARPVSNPNGIIRRTIQEIMEAPLCHFAYEPVFLGVEQRLKEKLGLSILQHEPETFDIDLDEDGPLREEYLPRRRVSNGSSSGGSDHSLAFHSDSRNGGIAHHYALPRQSNINLPPPAKWSPAGDEPIGRSSDRTGQVYLPVQPPPRYVSTVPTVYHPWPTSGLPYTPFRHYPESDYMVNSHILPQFAYWAPVSCPSTVQHSQAPCTPDYYTGPNHVRGYSLGGYDYGCNDISLVSDRIGRHDHSTASWTPLHQYGYVPSKYSLALHPPLNYRSTWIRA